MTLVVAMRATDGVIMASDSQSTEATGAAKTTVDKVFPLTEMSVAGCSGMGQMCTEIKRNCAGLPNRPVHEMGEALVSRFHPVVSQHYSRYIPTVPGLGAGSNAAFILAAGRDPDGTPWIIEIDPHCQYTHYEVKGFHAIGSGAEGAQHAIAVLSHFQVQNNPIDYGLMVMTRVMDSVVATAAYSVGPPIKIWVVDKDGPRQLSEPEIEKQRSSVHNWEAAERDALEQLYAGQATASVTDLAEPPSLSED